MGNRAGLADLKVQTASGKSDHELQPARRVLVCNPGHNETLRVMALSADPGF
jgi:hypothetical protein